MQLASHCSEDGEEACSLMRPGVNTDVVTIVQSSQCLQRPVHDITADVEPSMNHDG